MKKAKRRLKQIMPLEVSLVKYPANMRRFLLLKNYEGKEGFNVEELIRTILETKLDDETAVDEAISKLVAPELVEPAKAVIKLIRTYKDQLSPEALEKLLELAGVQSKEEYPAPENSQESVEVYGETKKSVDMDSLPPELRERLEALWKEREELIKKNQELEQILKEEREEKTKAEYIAKAREFSKIPIQTETLGLMLKSISEKLPDYKEEFVRLLKAANEAFEQVTGEAGSNQSLTTEQYTQLDQYIEYLQKSAGLTRAEAITKAFAEHPEWYDEYRKKSIGK